MWQKGVLSVETPKGLLNAVFFAIGKNLCLCGGAEHCELKVSQFDFGSDQDGEFVVYTENGSKNHCGSYKDKWW